MSTDTRNRIVTCLLAILEDHCQDAAVRVAAADTLIRLGMAS